MLRRPPFQPTCLEVRAKIVWMWVEGLPARNIAKATGTSVTTIYRWVRRWEKEDNVLTKPRKGRPRGSRREAKKRQQHSSSRMSASLGVAVKSSVYPQIHPSEMKAWETSEKDSGCHYCQCLSGTKSFPVYDQQEPQHYSLLNATHPLRRHYCDIGYTLGYSGERSAFKRYKPADLELTTVANTCNGVISL